MIDFTKKINPLYKSLKTIAQFDDINDSPFLSDYEYLKSLIQLIEKEASIKFENIKNLQIELEELRILIQNYSGADKSDSTSDFSDVKKKIHRNIEGLNRLIDQIVSPFFGRIIFDRIANREIPSGHITSYIGKFAYFDEDTKRVLITDWRAPIANLYYMNQGPTKNVSFESPAGIQSGNLTDKTQFDITLGRITSVYSAQTGNATADAFLLAQLKRKVGKKLTDIVSTIQDQQNSIIREGIENPMIIQGVAGSGKTTILLHRIAYLLYGYQKEISARDSLIIAPSKMFLDYISEILPSLGVDQIQRNTYLFWAKSVLNWEDDYLVSGEDDDLEVKTFKGGKDFIKVVEKYLEDFEENLFNNINDPLKEQIAERFYNLTKQHPNLSMIEKINLSVQYAFANLQYQYKSIGTYVINDDVNIKRQKAVMNYVKSKTNIFNLYKDIFKSEQLFNYFNIDANVATRARNYSLKTLSKSNRINKYKQEDLAPLIWMRFKIYGTGEFLKDYVAIDEAQDMSLFQLLTLHKVAKNGNLTIAGDMAQSIIEPFYLNDWKEVIDLYKEYFGTETHFHQLDKCYRTTIEIIEYANKIIEGKFPKSYKLPEAVLRHGDRVIEHTYNNEISSAEFDDNDRKDLIKLINTENEKGFATLAIICRDSNHADKVFANIESLKKQLNRKVFSYKEEDYHEGILILPVERAKGLEFDSVIIADMNDINYPKSFLNAKLFYVAVTRALHRLHIIENKNQNKSSLMN